MNHGLTPVRVVITFVVVLVFYFAAYNGMQHWQTRKGAWEATFASDASGNPSMTIYQPKLNISSVEVVFPGEKVIQTNSSQTVKFNRVDAAIPFGKVIFLDLMILPGTVTLDLFGHEVELLPRTLILNKKEFPWRSDSVIELSQTNKLPVAPKPPKNFYQK